jgi:hypothetical protein
LFLKLKLGTSEDKPKTIEREEPHMNKYPELEENLRRNKLAVEQAGCENVVELCRKYLRLLTEYRDELYKFRGTPEINSYQGDLSKEKVDRLRKEIRFAVTSATEERNRIEALVKSFTVISGYEAIETLNRQKYKGHGSWNLKAGGVKFGDEADADKMTVLEAVETAGKLRREEYVALKQHNFNVPDTV